jgi:transcriptional regulator with XRE-family HTH domain
MKNDNSPEFPTFLKKLGAASDDGRLLIERDGRLLIERQEAIATAVALLRHARGEAALSQKELGGLLATTQSAIARLENPTTYRGRGPGIDTIAAALSACGFRLTLSAIPHLDEKNAICDNNASGELMQLSSLMGSIKVCYLRVDCNDEIIHFNKYWQSFHSGLGDYVTVGTQYEEFLRAGIGFGCFPEAESDEQEWLRKRLEIHRNPSKPFLLPRENDIWLEVSETKTIDGGVATIARDVGPLRSIKAAYRSLDQAVERIGQT